jgi:hypothetical protein
MSAVVGILGVAGFVLAVFNLWRSRLLPKHREYQQFRREIDGFTLPWRMCWVYWFETSETALQSLVAGRRFHGVSDTQEGL